MDAGLTGTMTKRERSGSLMKMLRYKAVSTMGDRTRVLLSILGMIVAIACSAASVSAQQRSQKESTIPRSVIPIFSSFLKLSDRLNDPGRFSAAQNDYYRSTRSEVCSSLPDDRHVYVNSGSISAEITRIVESSSLVNLRAMVHGEERFREFLVDERKYLEGTVFDSGVWRLTERMAVAARKYIVQSDKEMTAATLSGFSSTKFSHGVALLCKKEPVGRSSWRKWIWSGGQLLGGTAMFLGNLFLVPEPTTKTMSMFVGTIIASTGYSELSALTVPAETGAAPE